MTETTYEKIDTVTHCPGRALLQALFQLLRTLYKPNSAGDLKPGGRECLPINKVCVVLWGKHGGMRLRQPLPSRGSHLGEGKRLGNK